jgi:hypothetical protein
VANVPRPFDHKYVPPPLAVTLICVTIQVKTVVFDWFEIATVGGVVFCKITCVVDPVQPFTPVAVTEYVAGVITETPAEVPNPFDQTYEIPPVASKFIEFNVQFNSFDPVWFVIPTVGGVIF